MSFVLSRKSLTGQLAVMKYGQEERKMERQVEKMMSRQEEVDRMIVRKCAEKTRRREDRKKGKVRRQEAVLALGLLVPQAS